jgi:hypothetical protein
MLLNDEVSKMSYWHSCKPKWHVLIKLANNNNYEVIIDGANQCGVYRVQTSSLAQYSNKCRGAVELRVLNSSKCIMTTKLVIIHAIHGSL